jgi:hypothetical protein
LSALDLLGFRLEDLIEFSKEIFEENHVLVEHAKEMKDLVASKDQELGISISDNKKLSHQIHDMVSRKTLSRSV